MIPDSEYKLAYSNESYLDNGKPIGVKIHITGNLPDNLVLNRAGDNISTAIWRQYILNDPLRKTQAAEEKKEIINLFEGKNIFVEETENQYCDMPCCCDRPWFTVTTSIGRFKIGWRKRVIFIGWGDTLQKKTSDELFPEENVTKGDFYIHAWGYEKAKEYINKICEG